MNTAKTALSMATRNAAKLGVTIPKATAAAIAEGEALAEKVRSLDLEADVAGAVLAALAKGADPFTDPDVIREVTRQRVRESGVSLDNAVTGHAQHVINTHAAEILEAFRGAFDTAADDLARAHAKLGDIALDDTDVILKQGGNVAALWAKARQAEETINAIRQTFGVLLGNSDAHVYEAQYRALAIADIPPADFLAHGLRHNGITAWDITRNGWPLDLATPETYAARIAAVLKEMQAEQARPAEEFRKNFQRLRGVTVA